MGIISREDWGARAPKYTYPLPVYPVKVVYIHHGASPKPDATLDAEASVVRSYQRYHMDTRGWSDIAYNLLVGDSGNGYEGRGYRNQGGATGNNLDRSSLSICYIGNGSSRVSDAALDAIVFLIDLGISAGHISPNVTVKGHRDGYSTSCPGDALYQAIPEIQSRITGNPEEDDVIPFDEWRAHYNNIEHFAAPDGIVAFVQDRLLRRGYNPGDVDGIKGPATDAAVVAFELDHGHNGDDRFGRPSWDTFLSNPPAEEVEVPVPFIPEELDAAVRAAHDETSKALYIVNTSE